MEVLQTSALPLGDGAVLSAGEDPADAGHVVLDDQRPGCGPQQRSTRRAGFISLHPKRPTLRSHERRTRTIASTNAEPPTAATAHVRAARAAAHSIKIWSGKRDSNPRLRPWQGRTLPLSYSRLTPNV